MKSLTPLAAQWARIDALLDQALALPEQDRAAWLQALQGDDAALRETLSALLQSPVTAPGSGFMEALPRLPMPAEGGEPAAGDRVGPYVLIEPLGQGGMGSVWLAERHDGTLRRRVALKLPRQMWGGAVAERLARERDILATLEHPHIARLYDAGVDAQGRPWLAMEVVHGLPIDRWCAERGLAVRDRLALLLQVAAAVSHAHARLVVHRDLKPANILVTDEGQVRLLDFGIAKLLEGDRTQETALTRLAGSALTLDYASPEQIRGEPLTTASDIYSLGVVAYELLAGVRPYRLKRGSAAELEEAIASTDPPLASSVAVGPQARKALRGDLDAILNQALKKVPGERMASVDAFAQDIERHLHGEPVQARPDSRRYRAGKFVRRHRAGVAMAAAVALAVLGGSGVAVWQAVVAREEAARASAEVDRQEAVRNLYIAAVTRMAVLARDDPSALTKPGAINGVLREELERRLKRPERTPGEVQAQLEAMALQLNYAGDFEGSLAIGERYLAHLKQHGADPAVVINAHSLVGGTLALLRRVDESEAIRRAGVAWAPQADDERTTRGRLVLQMDLGNMLMARGKRREAEAFLQGADAVCAARFAGDLVRAVAQQKLAAFYNGFDDARALAYARQAAQALHAAANEDDYLHDALNILGEAQASSGLPEQAVPVLRQNLALSTRLYGRDDRNTVRVIGRLAAALARTGDVEGARALLQQSLAQQPASAAGNLLALHARLLELAWLQGDVQAAWPHLSADPAAHLRLLPARGAEIFVSLEARLLALAGRGSDALARAAVLHRDWRDRGLPSLAWLRILEALAVAQLASGDAAAARATAFEMLGILDGEQARSGWYWRVGNELAALAAARGGDAGTARDRLARAQAVTGRPPSGVEGADALLRQAEVLALLGRPADAAATARAALAGLGTQHPASPRLAQARQLGGG